MRGYDIVRGSSLRLPVRAHWPGRLRWGLPRYRLIPMPAAQWRFRRRTLRRIQHRPLCRRKVPVRVTPGGFSPWIAVWSRCRVRAARTARSPTPRTAGPRWPHWSGDVTFDVDSSALTDRAKQVLDEIVNRWNGKPPATVTVGGAHGFRRRRRLQPDALRATSQAVADYLISKVPSLNVQSSGKGESEPVASETNADGSVNEAGKAANRHVDVRWG